MRWIGLLLCGSLLTACEVTPGLDPQSSQVPTAIEATKASPIRSQVASRRFVEVVKRVEPVAERECRARTTQINCDFKIVVDDRPNQKPNAFQTQDSNGRPIIAFNIPLILAARNEDELAFVMGHEAAHHISGHLIRTMQNARVGAVVMSGLAALGGASADAVKTAGDLGAQVGARSYSKGFEIEADELGTVIGAKAGYNPLVGVKFFTQIPDPGNKFLGTHPPNAARVAAVKRVAGSL